MRLTKTALCLLLMLTSFGAAKADRGMGLALKNVLNNYFEMQKALAANNSTLATEKSQGMIWDLKTIPVNAMTDSQHSQWFGYLDKLMRGCRGVSQGNNIGEQKQSFSTLSADLFEALKMLNANPIPVYKLTADGRYWLGKTSSAKSPYGGKAGSVQGTFKAH